jgi:two-component system sensor histidine kinase UhpB
MRTDAALLGKELEKTTPDLARAKRLDGAILSQVDLLQQTNRRVLERLAPAGLSELGLGRAIGAMVDLWRGSRANVELKLHAAGALDSLDGTTQLTVYRIVQEGLTNAFRHSEASRIDVRVEAPSGDDAARGEGQVLVQIRDNGRGRGEAPRDGFGLKAMRERVNGLRGEFAMTSLKEGGTALTVALPADTKSARMPKQGSIDARV